MSRLPTLEMRPGQRLLVERQGWRARGHAVAHGLGLDGAIRVDLQRGVGATKGSELVRAQARAYRPDDVELVGDLAPDLADRLGGRRRVACLHDDRRTGRVAWLRRTVGGHDHDKARGQRGRCLPRDPAEQDFGGAHESLLVSGHALHLTCHSSNLRARRHCCSNLLILKMFSLVGPGVSRPESRFQDWVVRLPDPPSSWSSSLARAPRSDADADIADLELEARRPACRAVSLDYSCGTQELIEAASARPALHG